MKRPIRIMGIVVQVLVVVLLLAYGVWKTNQEWQMARQCRCGNSDALFSKSDDYFRSHILGNSLGTLSIAAGLILLVVDRSWGYAISILGIAVRLILFFNQGNSNTYDQFERTTALIETIALIVPMVIVLFIDMLNDRRR